MWCIKLGVTLQPDVLKSSWPNNFELPTQHCVAALFGDAVMYRPLNSMQHVTHLYQSMRICVKAGHRHLSQHLFIYFPQVTSRIQTNSETISKVFSPLCMPSAHVAAFETSSKSIFKRDLLDCTKPHIWVYFVCTLRILKYVSNFDAPQKGVRHYNATVSKDYISSTYDPAAGCSLSWDVAQ